MDLKVRSADSYAGRSSQYSLPLEVGYYSINSDGKFFDDNHQMKYLAMPNNLTNLHLDLNDGYCDYIHLHKDTEDRFPGFLKWIVSHEEVLTRYISDCTHSNSKVDFVFFRGLLTSVSSTMYEKSEGWMIFATKFRSVIYMDIIKTDGSAKWNELLGEKGERLATWGFKFEQYMTTDTMSSRPDTSVPVNENEKYYSVVKCKLDNHRILLSAEIDSVDPKHFTAHGNDPSSVLRYIELKTSRLITSEKQYRNFLRYKLIKWYLQSHFAGVPRVICGFRDDDGIVRKVTNYNVRDMPSMAKGLWCPRSCFNFCSHFLNHVKICGMKDDPRVVYRIDWEPGSDITFEDLSSEYPDFQLLPDWYIERVNVT